MFRGFVAIISVLSLIFPTQALAIECLNPFAATQSQFQLVEKLKCNVVTTPVMLQITAVNVSASSASPYLSPGCDKTSTYFNLYQGADNIIDFSDTMASAHSDAMSVSRACDGVKLFRFDRKPLLFTTPSGKKLNTSVRIFAQDASLKLLGYVQSDENTAKQLIIRGPDDAVMATAVKIWRNIDTTNCEAIWTVTNNANTELSATMISFLLSLNDNVDFSCLASQPPQAPGMSSVAAVAIGVALGGVLVIAGGIGAACYCMRNNPRYDKVKLIN